MDKKEEMMTREASEEEDATWERSKTAIRSANAKEDLQYRSSQKRAGGKGSNRRPKKVKYELVEENLRSKEDEIRD